MGTNFYTLNGKHIGKRYAAGIWCWGCRQRVSCDRTKQKWICTKCGKHSTTKSSFSMPAYLELGFVKTGGRPYIKVEGQSRHYVFIRIEESKICEILTEEEFKQKGIEKFFEYL